MQSAGLLTFNKPIFRASHDDHWHLQLLVDWTN
jgi:hypothetical protein